MEHSARRLRRFYFQDNLPLESQTFCLSPGESKHLAQILRLKPGDSCLVLDSAGIEVHARVESFRADGRVDLLVLKRYQPTATFWPIRIYQAIPKGVKFETLIQKAQEIGVSALIPLMTERTVVRIEQKKESPKMVRWHKIAAEAAKQSGCRTALEISVPMTLTEAFRSLGAKSLVAILHPSASSIPLRLWADHLSDKSKEAPLPALNLFIGPEGGFSSREISAAEEAAARESWDFQQLGLGASILKTDTAFIGVAAFLKFWMEGLLTEANR